MARRKKNSMFDFKLSRKDKKTLKKVAIGIGLVALVGASGRVAERVRQQRG